MSFFGQALVFIGASIIFVPIFQKLGFGSVLGYLLAGVIVGPHGLKFIEDADSIRHFSELGVVFLLFVIGLEIQPRKLWSMRQHLLGLGGVQVLLCSVFFSIAAYFFGISPVVAGIVGFSLSLSSTAFAVQTLTERNQFNTQFGRASFSILLMQDLVAIPALAIIPALGISVAQNVSENGHDMASAPAKVGLGLALIVFLIIGSKYLFRPIFRIIASTRSREIFTATTLFIVLGVAALMEKIGLSAALGSFIAGVLLSESEYRHELESDLEPFKALLMGLFFIAVGMGVSVELLIGHPFQVLGLSIAYLASKALLIYGVGRIFKMDHQNSKLMATTIAQGGEFAFVIFGIVIAMQMAPPEIIAWLTAIITLSMAMSPIVSIVNERMCSLSNKKMGKPQYDLIKDESPDIIIAGFGRFGQIFGRVLRAQGFPFVAIDHDAAQIELVRRFGNKVYYGDASRRDLLETAGAAKAKYFVLAIDDVEMSVKTAQVVREHFPNLKIYARARNRGHAFDLLDMGIQDIKRETFDSSAHFVGELLEDMGIEKSKATKIIEKFKGHDEIMMMEQYKVRSDDKMFISVSQQGVAQLAQVLNDDTLHSHISAPDGK